VVTRPEGLALVSPNSKGIELLDGPGTRRLGTTWAWRMWFVPVRGKAGRFPRLRLATSGQLSLMSGARKGDAGGQFRPGYSAS
jgi:hypothetical protein